MDLFICTNVFIPIRSAPVHRAEMVSQLLFGERFQIIDRAASWVKIETLFDLYTGWIDSLHHGYEAWDEESHGIIAGNQVVCSKEDNTLLILSPGSEIFGLNDSFSGFSIGGKQYIVRDPQASLLTPHSSLNETALQFLNVPYLWGGRTDGGIDCSGLVQVVCKIHGIKLPRDAARQAELGTVVSFFGEARPGDLIFFSGETERISHTGIFLGSGTIIHSSGTVRIDRVDHQGIWREDAGMYTHRLRVIKRVI